MLHTNTVNRQPSTVNSSFTISILASPLQQSEIHQSPLFRQHKLLYAENLHEMLNRKADAYMDLLFEEDAGRIAEKEPDKKYPASTVAKAGSANENAAGPDSKRIELLARLLPSPVFINSVIHTLSELHPDLIRINAWPGFLESSLLEAAASPDSIVKARRIFGDRILFVGDVPGFVNPRIISMIINEAFFTLRAGTSSREEIDIAMKLGTGYPLGPFEWSEKIGHHRVAALLSVMGRIDSMYEMAGNMVDG